MTPKVQIIHAEYNKIQKAYELFLSSVKKAEKFDPSVNYSPEDLEPFDALVSRFERLVELFMSKMFKAVELFEAGDTGGTLRDRLNLMVKLDIIENADDWVDLRETRNKIAHDYLPDKIKILYEKIGNEYKLLIEKTFKNLQKYLKKKKIV
ncbi:MAG: nucleotidyltransferase substrate binding protein [Oligoflexia bacterium]|nr:nucleotidyltransferase substrate binding protein [Oligoflexia bacterium]